MQARPRHPRSLLECLHVPQAQAGVCERDPVLWDGGETRLGFMWSQGHAWACAVSAGAVSADDGGSLSGGCGNLGQHTLLLKGMPDVSPDLEPTFLYPQVDPGYPDMQTPTPLTGTFAVQASLSPTLAP